MLLTRTSAEFDNCFCDRIHSNSPGSAFARDEALVSQAVCRRRARRRCLCVGRRGQALSRFLRVGGGEFYRSWRARNCRRDAGTGPPAGVRPHQPVHNANRRGIRGRTAGLCWRALPRRGSVFHLRRIGIYRHSIETRAAVSGGNRSGQALSGSQPKPELSRIDAGGAGGFGKQETSRDVSADGARVRPHRHALLLSLRLRLHRRMPQLRPAVCRGTGNCHRNSAGRGRRFHL